MNNKRIVPPATTTEDMTYGPHAVHACLLRRPADVSAVYVLPKRHDVIVAAAVANEVPVKTVDKAYLARLCRHTQHQGIVALTAPFRPLDEQSLYDTVRGRRGLTLLALVGVTDPRNVGATLRAVDAFGADGVIMTAHDSPPFTGVVAKASSGAREYVPIYTVSNLARAINTLQQLNVWVYGLTGDGDYQLPSVPRDNDNTLLVFGAEADGLPQRIRAICDRLVAIPMADPARRYVDSLNIAAAVAVTLYVYCNDE